MKYLVGVGGLVVVVALVFFLFLDAGPPTTEPDIVAAAPDVTPPAPVPAAPAAPEYVALQDAERAPPDQDKMLENMAADTREGLPSSVTETLTMTDAAFLPLMRIMEYTYVTTATDARASARDMRALIEAGAEKLCLEGRKMFEMGVTLRNSFEDRDGTVFQRVYLLPEDCQQFY